MPDGSAHTAERRVAEARSRAWPAALWPVRRCGAGFAKDRKDLQNGGTLRFYGQINKGVLTYDDGQESESYGLIDNDNSNTRFGLTYTQDFGDRWNYLGTIEVAYAPFSTTNTNILQQSPPSSAYEFTNANIRKIDNKFSHPDYGAFYLGQGDMASNNTAEVDLSGTTVIRYSSVADSAGAQLLRQSDGVLSDIEIKDAFTNYDGLSRQVRVRYDTAVVGLRPAHVLWAQSSV